MTETGGSSAGTVDSARLVNGVFQGGGAKMIAYVGALRAVEERGLWFGGVAGSSAGAIAASLIASGMNAAELREAIPAGLAAARSPIPARLGKAVIGHATSVFEGRGLRAWLDATFAARVGKLGDQPVTFAELHTKTNIELYVLALDLATGLPVVFCRRTTPDVEVAGAVVASSAIPGAFPAGRAVFRSAAAGATVHQLVDGGAYANYPSFVFDDRSFRAWLRNEAQRDRSWADDESAAWAAEEDRPVLGFVLSDPESSERPHSVGFIPMSGPDVNRRFDQGPTYTSPKRLPYLIGAMLSSDWARLIIAAALAVWVATSIAVLPVGFRRFATWLAGWLPDWLYPLALTGTLGVVTLAVVISIGTIALLVLAGRIIADTLLPTFKSILGVPLDAPPWLGMGDDAVLLRVPHGTLKTVKFEVDDTTIENSIDGAAVSVGRQLDDPLSSRRLAALIEGTTPEHVSPRPCEHRAEREPHDERFSPIGISTLVVATSGVGILAWWSTNLAGSDAIGPILAAVTVGLVGGGAALWFLAARTGKRAALRAGYGVGTPVLTDGRTAWLLLGAGAFLVVAGIATSAIAMADRGATTTRAVVTSAVAAPPGSEANAYVLRVVDDRRELSVESDRHLRLGEQVFVDIDDETVDASVTGALDDFRFALAVVAWALGLGLLTAGSKKRRFTTRCRRLEALVDDWDRT